MIEQGRICVLNNKKIRKGKYVLYWMQAAQRTEYNHALEYAIEKANELEIAAVVVFGLTDEYPEANLRHYYFMLEGLQEVRAALKEKGVQCVIKYALPKDAVTEMAEKAALLVVDDGHTHIQRKWRSSIAQHVDCLMEEVETNVIVPVREGSDKENFSAGTFRPRIQSNLDNYLKKVSAVKPLRKSLKFQFGSFDIKNVDEAVSKLDIDCSVGKVNFKGGTKEAKRQLSKFIKTKLNEYPENRNDPNKDGTSNMSPYLHFGQISPLYIAMKVIEADSKGGEAYLEELIVRRELSYNFLYYNNHYDTYKSLPPWARNTLNLHSHDKREYTYSIKEFETAKTHDPYWNAAQKQMVLTGKMHGYMRMYWGKKILEWSRNPQIGLKIALSLNNKYELDGRDPNGFAGVAWCFGKHDRAWAERDVFGKVRYMNAAGLKRKFDADNYVSKIQDLENSLK